MRDARLSRPENSVGIGEFWYDPGIWNLPLSPAARVLYAALCSYLTQKEINRHDLRAALKNSTDPEVADALKDLADHNLLSSIPGGYAVNPVREFRS